MVKKGHANGQTVGHLIENAGLRSIGDTWIDFQAAIHRTGMQNQRIGTSEPEPLGRKLKLQNIFFGGERRLVQALGLHAKDDDYLGAVKGFVDARNATNIWRERFQFARYPHRGTAQSDVCAEFAEQMDIGARHAAVQDVAKNHDTQALQFSFTIADGKRVKQGLGGMFVRAVTCVHDRNAETLGDKFRSARGTVANHDAVWAHGFQRPKRIEQRLALFQAGRFGLQIHGVRAQASRSGGEADARTRGILEKRQRDSFAAQSGQFFQRVTVEFLEWLGLIENKRYLLAGEVFDSKQVLQALQHGFPLLPISPGLPKDCPRSGNAIDENDAFLAVNFLQTDFHYFGVACFHVSAYEGRLNRHLAVAAVN